MAEYVDPRSSGRKELRRNVLQQLSEMGGTYACFRCGIGPTELPSSTYWNPDWNINLPPLDKREEGVYLDADHKDKDWSNNDASNGELLCRKCHKNKDSQSKRGVSSFEDDLFGYASTWTQKNLAYATDPNYQEKVLEAQDYKELMS